MVQVVLGDGAFGLFEIVGDRLGLVGVSFGGRQYFADGEVEAETAVRVRFVGEGFVVFVGFEVLFLFLWLGEAAIEGHCFY